MVSKFAQFCMTQSTIARYEYTARFTGSKCGGIGSTAAHAVVTSRPAARASMNYTGRGGVWKYHSCAVV